MNNAGDATNKGGGDPPTPKLLHPVHPRDRWPRIVPPCSSVRRVAVIDTETEGLDPLRHGLIELAVAIVAVDDAGDIIAIENLFSGLRDPGRPLSREVVAVTGITDEKLVGKTIDPLGVVGALDDVSAILSYNAGFDRPVLEQFARGVSSHRWGCVLKDIDYRGLGFEPGSQGWVLAQAGYYNPHRHRALHDVQSLITLLDHRVATGESLMAKVLQAIERPAWRFEAKAAPYRFKDDLKDWRYSWSQRHRLWQKHVRAEDLRYEYGRYRKIIGQRPKVVPLPPEERYRADWNWRPA